MWVFGRYATSSQVIGTEMTLSHVFALEVTSSWIYGTSVCQDSDNLSGSLAQKWAFGTEVTSLGLLHRSGLNKS